MSPPCPLLSLSAELQNTIIDRLVSKSQHLFTPRSRIPKELRDAKNEEHASFRDGMNDQHDDRNEPSASEREENASSLLNLSSTCTFYRSLLGPVIFSSIFLRDTAKSAASVAAVARGRQRQHVRKLHFIGSALELQPPVHLSPAGDGLNQPARDDRANDIGVGVEEVCMKHTEGDTRDDEFHEKVEEDTCDELYEKVEDDVYEDVEEDGENESNFSSVSQIFPIVCRNVLSNLNGKNRYFPNLRTVIIEFAFNVTDDLYDHYEGIDEGDELETPEETLVAESSDTWRALTNRVLEALAENSDENLVDNHGGLDTSTDNDCNTFSELHILDLPPRPITALALPAWHALLSNNIKRFTLKLGGWDNGAGWELNTCGSTLAWTRSLQAYFFDHLAKCEEFTLLADESAPLGLDPGRFHCHLALRPAQMPRLRKVELRYMIICEELTAFLVGHAHTLKSVVMRDCFADMQPLEYEGGVVPTWGMLFDALVEAGMGELVDVLVEHGEKGIDFGWVEENDEDVEDERLREVSEVRKLLAVGGAEDRRLFAYSTLDDKYGMVMGDDQEVRRRFLQGMDQRSWNALMGVTAANRKGQITSERASKITSVAARINVAILNRGS